MPQPTEVLGIFRYEPRDIKPESIVIEITNSPGPGVEHATIYICRSLMDVAKTCKKVALSWTEGEVIDLDFWVEGFNNISIPDDPDYDLIHKLAVAQLNNLVRNARELDRDVKSGKRNLIQCCRKVVKSFQCFDHVGDIRIMNKWLKQNDVQEWLFRFLKDDEEDVKNEDLNLPAILEYPKHNELIAGAINKINMQPHL